MQADWDVPTDGPLDRACEMILERIAGARPAQAESSDSGRRAASGRGSASGRGAASARGSAASIEEMIIAGPGGKLALRLYRPERRRGPALLVWLHGGGFVSGGLNSHAAPLHALARRSGCAILAVDYRLAPAHPYPAALEDSYAALSFAAAHADAWGCDPARLAVGGDSAGGNLAAGAARLCRDRAGPPLALQVLVYPDADARAGFNHPSWRLHDGLVLDRESKDRALDQYLPRGIDRTLPLVSPALAPVNGLAGLAAALILTAEFDPQRDEGELYASRLRDAGVAVSLKRFAGMIHGFWQMGGVLAQAQAANVRIAEALSALG